MARRTPLQIRPTGAPSYVLMDDIGSRADDPVCGDRIRQTRNALTVVAAASPDKVVEFGISGLARQLAENSHALAAEKANAPVLLPAYADLWSQTWPIPNADPDVSLFLHGPKRSPAGIQIVWRADIVGDDLDDRNRVAALLDLVPPSTGEATEILSQRRHSGRSAAESRNPGEAAWTLVPWMPAVAGMTGGNG